MLVVPRTNLQIKVVLVHVHVWISLFLRESEKILGHECLMPRNRLQF